MLCHNTHSILNECAHIAPNWLPEETMQAADNRSPNPPMGYACECSLTTDQQIDLVAEFHVHRIRPSRIAYRLGIDIAQVEAWLSGEQDSERFQRLIAAHKRRKYHMQVRKADRLRGQRAYELRLAAQQDLHTGQPVDMRAPTDRHNKTPEGRH